MIEVYAGHCDACGQLRGLSIRGNEDGSTTIAARCRAHELEPALTWEIPAGEQYTIVMDVQPNEAGGGDTA